MGVYPGDAGLSVVTYLALGLPVVVHDDLYKHMGPEPSYVSEENGKLFTRGDCESLKTSIDILRSSCRLKLMSLNNLKFYSTINGCEMAPELLNVIR